MSHDAAVLEQLPPEKLLDTSNFHVITPAIMMMGKVETVEQYLEHERTNRNRKGVIRRLTERRDDINEKHGETPPQPITETGDSSTPSVEVEIPTDNPDEPPVQIQIEPPTQTETPTSVNPPSPSTDLLALVHEHGAAGIARSPEPPAWDEL